MYVKPRRVRVSQALALVRERGREKLARIAWEMGWSYKYMRYSVLPEILSITECVEHDRERDELVWVCEDEDGG